MLIAILIPILTSATALLPIAHAAQPAALLTAEPGPRWTWTKGQSARYQVTQSVEASSEGMLTYSVRQRQEQRLKMSVADVSASGDATIDVTLEAISINVVPSDGAPPIAVSSTLKPTVEEQNPSGVCHAMVGLTLTIVVASTGEVREIRGLDAFQARVRKAFAEPAALSAMAADVLGSLSEERLRIAIEPVFLLGSTATKQIAVPIAVKGLGSLITQDSSASNSNEGVLTVHRTTEYALVKPNADEIARAFDVTLTDARAESESVLEPSKGAIRTSTSTLRMTTTLTPKTGAIDAGERATTRRVTQTFTIEMVPEMGSTPSATPSAKPGTP